MICRRRLATPLVAGLLIAVFLLRLSSPTIAHAQTQPGQAGPETVQIGAYIVNLGDFNVGQGTFNADFYLWFSWPGAYYNPGATTPFASTFELMNGVVDTKTLVEADQNISGTGQNYLIYRIQASMSDPVTLQNYPFDKHSLTIEVEDEVNNESALVYQADPETRLDSLVGLQGWGIQTTGASATVIDHFYNTTFGYPGQTVYETYSRFIVTIPIERPVIPAMVQTFVPIVLIEIVAMTAFYIKMGQFGTRLSLNVVSLLTAAAFQISLTSNIPQFGFLTLADRLIIGVYILLVYALVITVALHSLKVGRRLQLVTKLNDWNWLIFPTVSATLIIVQFIF